MAIPRSLYHGASVLTGPGHPGHSRRPGGPMIEPRPAFEPTAIIVVRAGAVDRFAALKSAFAPEGVDVVWDRRLAERRQPDDNSTTRPERRRQDRRGPTPASWALLDFLVVPVRAPVS